MSYRRFPLVHLLASLLLCLSVLGAALGAEPERSLAPETAALVQNLGDESYEVRDRAARQLADLGLQARAALEAGLADDDPEVRRRCRWILQGVLEADYAKRLQAFADDKEAKQQHDLPGWDRYRRIVGPDEVARELFIEMQNAEYGLLVSAATGPEAAADSLRLRLRQVYSLLSNPDPKHRKPPSLGTTAALLFVTSDARLDLPRDLADNSYLMNLVQQADFRKALTGGKHRSGARKLLGQWIVRPTHVNLLHMKLQMAVQYGIKQEGLELALRAVKNSKGVPGPMRVYAVGAIGQLGGKQYAATLATLLDDKTECGRRIVNKVTTVTEVRDVALAWLIHVTGQKHADYGQERVKADFERIVKNPRLYMNFSNCGFDDAARRDEALKKWKAWTAKNPLPKPPDQPKEEADDQPAKQPAGRAAAQPAVVQVIGPGIIFAGGAIVPPANGKASDEPPKSAGFDAADRLQVRNLSLARELCQQQRYAEAARLLDNVLKAPSGCSFRPDVKVPLFRSLKPAAERLIGRLPTKGREAYDLQFASTAEELFNRVVATGSTEALAGVAERFFYTRAGADATYLLAASYLNHGHPLHAALYLQRLQNLSWHADRFEPALSATLATCWSRAGMPGTAEEVLQRMQARYPGTTVWIAGRQREMFTQPDQALPWLESLVGPPHKPAPGGGWPMFRGGPARNVSTDVGSPFLKGDLLTSICDDPLIGDPAKRLQEEQRKQFRVALPKLHPLVVDQTILLRTATHIRAIDFDGGKLRWQSPLEDALWHFLQGKNEPQKESQTEALARGLQRRLWQDTTFGTLSSDAHCVFGVEDLAFGFRGDYQRMVVTPDGRWRLDPGLLKRYNLLTAYDVQSGKLRWEIGGPFSPGWAGGERVEQPGTFFLGPPLPLGGRLYVICEVERETRLRELDAETGSLISELTLVAHEEEPSRQMFMFMPFGLMPEPPRRDAVSPSYADGVLVCCTPENQIVAVDLTTRTPLWIYRTPAPKSAPGMNPIVAMQRRLYQAEQSDRANRWADASVTIAEGCVLLTPPELDELICLDLVDGHVRWSMPRRDGLYVGGVHRQDVIVVGRGGVWAVKLADGAPAWPQDRVALPAAALPSGRGYLGNDRYYVPLSSAEVVAIDLKLGRLASRCRSPEETIPGNLVSCRDSILSQGVDGLRRFEPLRVRKRELAAALEQQPGDPQTLADFGEVLLYDGQLAEAVTHLKRALALEPTPRTRQMLVDALSDGLLVDFEAFREAAEEFAALIKEPELRVFLLQQLALALEREGSTEPAWQTCLKLIDCVKQTEPEQKHHRPQRFSAAWVARGDRWIQARLGELRAAATPDQRAEMDRQIAARLENDRLPEFLAYFGTNPAAREVRLRLAGQLAEKQQWLEAERLFRHVLRTGSEPQQRIAVARLATLLRAAKQPDAAARFYRYLGAELAETVCLDGKTGRQLLEALPADDPVRRSLTSPQPWPVGKIRCEVSDRRSSMVTRYPIAIAGEGGPFGTQVSIEIDASRRKIAGHDALGRSRWEAALERNQTAVYYNGAMQSSSQGWLKGHLLVAQWGNRVFAIDTLEEKAKVLWSEEAYTAKPRTAGMPVFFGAMGVQVPRQARALPASDPLTLAVNNVCVCFQQERKLLAVDPLSGEVLWTRVDLQAGSDLFGDDELLFVTPPQADEATVFSVLDGRELRRCRVPPLKTRMWTLGRRVVTWSTSTEKARLTLVDPWTAEDLWQRDFDAKAQPWLIDGDEIGVLDPQGRLTVLALPGGDTTLTAKVDPLPSLKGIVLLRSARRYLLFANHRAAGQANVISMHSAYPMVQVNGRVYGFDRQTGERIWAADVQQQALRLNQPRELPVLTFCNRVQTMVDNRYKSTVKLLCLDTRNGRVLHRQTSSSGRPDVYQSDADAENHRVEVRSYLGTVKLTFTDEPPGDEPVEKVAAKDPPAKTNTTAREKAADGETAIQRALRFLKAAAKAKKEGQIKPEPLPESE